MRQGVSKITEAAIISRQTATPVPTAQPRAVGRARVSVHHKDGAVRLKDLHQAGAMKLLFPQGRPHPEAVMVNTAGGITGGDRFSVAAAALDNSRLTVTTQAAERAYRAQPGEVGRMETRLEVAAGARLNWLPQETILFNGSRFARRLRVDLAADARFLMVEPVVFGRLAMGEALTSARFSDRVEIRRDGQMIYYDGVELRDDIAATLDRPAVAGGARAMAALVLAHPRAESWLEPLRAMLPGTGGVSLLAKDLLVLRLLAADGFDLRQTLVPILDRLLPDGLPRAWRL
ncbi:urease accessory protein UreD [Phaeobacter gallaeciensis]|uniref:urease accessory protein UreD n=1 Tax=Phaeobacter gallaeciensis TaxID=60890 RepID=UPI00237F9191|nr:urease accessory protein UreD [Phaeobacter gallaeciensis]